MEQLSEAPDTRDIIRSTIDNFPGIRYRELLRMTGLTNGVLTYHLTALERSDLIRADRGVRVTRYYTPRVSDKESAVLKYIRHAPIRELLLFIFEHEHCTFNELVSHSRKAPSTVSSHLKRLREDGIVLVRYGEFQLYRIADKELFSEVLSKYRPGLVDTIIDNFADTMEEL